MNPNWELADYLQTLSPDERAEAVYLFDERAGIAIDSGATTEQAEQIALEEVTP